MAQPRQTLAHVGGGTSIFLRDPDVVVDCGASLGRGTNNVGELYALGMAFSQLAQIARLTSHIRRVVVFCDSKLALRACVSSRSP